MFCKQTRCPFMGTDACLKAFIESLLCLVIIPSVLCAKPVDLRFIDHPLIRSKEEVKGFFGTNTMRFVFFFSEF